MLGGVSSVLERSPLPPVGLQDVDHLRDVEGPDGLCELDRRLSILCREQGPLRAVVARIAWRLVDVRACERLGYARVSDYAAERLGLSGRSLQSLARVGKAFLSRSPLEHALVSGRLGWTRVRLLAGLPPEEDVSRWIARAERLTVDRLAKRVRAVDRYSADEGAAAETPPGGGLLELRCTPEVRRKWTAARRAASRAAGRQLGVAEAAELIAAEVLSALPAVVDDTDVQDTDVQDTGVEDTGVEDTGVEDTDVEDDHAPDDTAGSPGSAPGPDTSEAWPGWDQPVLPARGPQLDLDFELRGLVEGLDSADAFDVDERLRRALALEQSLEARIAPLLVLAWRPGVHRALGFATREAWVRERLGMDPTRARALVRLERACAECPPLAHAWRTGALSWVQASALLPLVSADPLGRFTRDWVCWAGRVTVRRLRDDAEHAVALAETDPETFRRTGGLPAEARRRGTSGATPGVARADREIGALHRDSAGESQRGEPDGSGGADAFENGEREIRADRRNPEEEPGLLHDERLAARAHTGLGGRPRPEETCSVLLSGSLAAVRLFRTALCTVRRRLEADTGRLPTAGDALGAMLDHAFAAWGEDAKVPARHRVFARDGWRCAAPGCSSMQNLHDHHVRFRSAGGSDAPWNRVTLCAFHHLRGVHAGRLRCTGRAPDELRWQLGIRAGAPPLLCYRSGDVRVPLAASPSGPSRHRRCRPSSVLRPAT